MTLTATSSWYNTSWAYRRKITFDNSAQAENLTNFPVLVKLDSTRINYSNTQDSGQDIRFTDSDGTTLLSYEIEKWDETGSSFVWVKVPQIDASSSTDYIYIYYGNSSATDGQAATSVWDSNYVGVWHLKETSGTTSSDSTSNSNNGTKTSSTEPNPTTSGQINGAQDFDGSNDRITVADPGTSSLDISGDLTISVWVKRDTATSVYAETMVSKRVTVTDTSNYQLYLGPTNRYVRFYNGTTEYEIAYSPPIGSWVHLDFVLNNASSLGTLYVNGASQGTVTTNIGSVNNGNFWIGFFDHASQDEGFHGLIDGVRVSNSTRSAAYIAAQYKSDSDTFNTFASEEQEYPSSGTLTASIFDTEFTGGAAWGTLTFAATTPTSTTAIVKVRTSNSSSMTGATAFSSCDAITSGTDISTNNCVTDSHRYAQYLITLGTSAPASTPTFTSFSLTFSTYDADAPSISLTALTPDPNSDNTPTLSGTATDSIGTVSNVQFQMDSTSGSWSSCSASDGSFNSASEAFSCTAATLTDGSHTMYVRATDSNGNTTSSGYASDTFTIDATTPVSIDLDSPGDNSYTNSERPTYKWKATTDATAGLSKYVLEIDNPSIGNSQPSGDFTIDNIPTSGTTDVTNNKYVIHFENFNDSDSANNYISVYTKSHSDWGSSENDGKLREGRVSWKVKAVDNAGNETSSSRTLFVDRSSPKVELTQINDVPFSSTNFSTTDKTPTVFGKITDSLSGGDSSQTQDDNGPKIASGPKQVDFKVEKKEGLGYKLITLYTINMDKPWYTCDGKELSDNTKQKCDKYLPLEYTSKENLELGTYKITLTGKDKADNSSSETTLTLKITTLAQITTPEEKRIIEEETKPLKPEEQEKIKEELEITKPVEPSALEKAQTQISQTSKNILNTTGNIIAGIFNGIGQGVKFTVDTTRKALAFVGDKTGQALAFVGKTTSNTFEAMYNGTRSILAYVGQGIGNGAKAVSQGLAFAGEKIGQGISTVAQGTGNILASIGQGIGNTGKSIEDGYNQLANNAPGVTKTILTGIGNGVSATTSTIATIAQNTASTIENVTHAIVTTSSTATKNTENFIGGIANNVGKTASSIAQSTTNTIGSIASAVTSTTSTVAHNTGSAIVNAAQNTVKATKSGIASIAFAIGEKTQGVAGDFSLALIRFAYNFVPEPTKISDVNVAVLSPTSVKVTWLTNHPANGKVNYGLDRTYPFDVQSEKRITHHEFTLTNLKPDTLYYFEVMSHNKNYVYDANREFKTPPAK